MKEKLLILPVAGVVSTSSFHLQAQSFYLAGDFNGWSPSANQMTGGPVVYDHVVTGGTPGACEQMKVTDGTWANSWSGGNLEVKYDAGGTNTIHFYPGSILDGWLPSLNRVGYDDRQYGLGNYGRFYQPKLGHRSECSTDFV